MLRVYHSFCVSGPKGTILADPAKFYADPTTMGSMGTNTITIVLAIISDFIIVSATLLNPRDPSLIIPHTQVYRTYIVWHRSVVIIVLPVALLLGDIGTS